MRLFSTLIAALALNYDGCHANTCKAGMKLVEYDDDECQHAKMVWNYDDSTINSINDCHTVSVEIKEGSKLISNGTWAQSFCTNEGVKYNMYSDPHCKKEIDTELTKWNSCVP